MMKLVARNFGIVVGIFLVGILSLFQYSVLEIGLVICVIFAIVVTLIMFYLTGDVSKKLMKRLVRYDMMIGFAMLNNYVLYITYNLAN